MKRILGMGNALVDVIIRLENEGILDTLGLPKGSMQLVDAERSQQILETLKGHKRSLSAGGSAANAIHGLAKLGAPVGYIGVIGEDELGGSFVMDMINAGVEPHMIHSNRETGRAVALITPDSERTFATFLGAAIELIADHLNPEVFMKYDYFHIEGYLVQNHELIERAVLLAKENNLMVSLDLSSYNVVEANHDFLHEIITNYVDIVFANEEEARAFTGLEPYEAVEEISKICKVAVVKTGPKGSLIQRNDELIEIGIIPVSPIDTTGAGDLYAAGFLFGHSVGMSLKECGELGALMAGNVIEVLGSKMNDTQWGKIFGHLESKENIS
jgi:sugar/nucleoside kinase (ribokinase family)